MSSYQRRPSTDAAEDDSPQPPLLRPKPRRPNTSITPLSASPRTSTDDSRTTGNSMPIDSALSKRDSSFLNITSAATASSNPTNEPGTPQKSRSILNLTSSALYGIYAPTSYNTASDDSRRPSSTSLSDQNEPLAISTPWGNGAQTPAIRDATFEPSFPSPASRSNGVSAEHLAASLGGRGGAAPSRRYSSSQTRRPPPPAYNALGAAVRILLLAGLGVAYGTLITHLHDARGLAPVRVGIERRSPLYLGFWGSIAVLLGILLPATDAFWGRRQQQQHQANAHSTTTARRQKTGSKELSSNTTVRADTKREREASLLGADWNPLVRSVGAFVGIAFAIRKLPWQSPQQLSLTLALVNPCIWYLVDRTRTGFYLAAATGISGSLLVLCLLPGVVPSPSLSVAAHSVAAAATARASHASSGTFWAAAANLLHAGAGAFKPSAAAASSAIASASAASAAAASTGAAVKAVEWAAAHSPGQLPQLLSLEGVGVATWTSSVLFCSTVFFGNVGRRLWG